MAKERKKMNPKYSFKAVDQNMSTNCGGGYTFSLTEWNEVDGGEDRNVFCHQWGFHSARNPLSCIDNFGTNGRFFVVEPGGDIDEEDNMLCSTRLRFVKELSLIEVIGFGIKYIVEHPYVNSTNCVINAEKYDAYSRKCFCREFIILRGKNPKVRASKGTVVALLKEEPDSSKIQKADMFIVGENGYEVNKYYSL